MIRKKVLRPNTQTVQPNSPIKSQQTIDEFQHMLQSMPPEEQIKVIKSITFSSFRSYSSGPLPAPESLDKYNKIIPDGADRIMKMAENQSNHRIKIEDKIIDGQTKQSSRGQTFGLVIAFGALVISGILAMFGHDTVASIIGGSTVIALASVFVIGKKEQKEQLAEKKPDFRNPNLTPNE